jgi:subtilisin family serine protease
MLAAIQAAELAILDTGIDSRHPDLSANCKGGYDFANDDSYPMDDNGHGTHCAGIVAAADNDEGVVGVAPEAHLYAVKVLNSGGSGYWSDVIAGIQWSVNNSMEVISMSFGGGYSESMEAACDAAYNAGIVVVASAGNSGNPPGKGDNVGYPAGYSSVIAVAATDSSDNRARWSSTGPAVELAAPGVSIYSTYLGGGYATMSGTSMACPHVAGTAALVIASSGGDVRQCLQATADDLGVAGRDDLYGYGLVDADGDALPDTTPPAKVMGLTVDTVSSSQLGLNWNANTETDLDRYNVYRSTTSGGSYDLIASPITNSYSDTGLAPLTTYYYKVSAVDSSDNEGTASDEASGTTSEAGGDVMHVSDIDMWYDTGGPN